MSKHTPGPWEVSSDCRELWPADGEKAFVEFCRLSSWYSDDELAANARLIAAAPELLGTLKLMVASCPVCEGLGEIEDGPEYLLPIGEYTQDYMSCPHCSDARQAIAKARGEEHP